MIQFEAGISKHHFVYPTIYFTDNDISSSRSGNLHHFAAIEIDLFRMTVYTFWYGMFVGVGVRVPINPDFSPLYFVQDCPGAHQASYPMGIGGSFLGSKAAGE
jgi:hypothetical protein